LQLQLPIGRALSGGEVATCCGFDRYMPQCFACATHRHPRPSGLQLDDITTRKRHATGYRNRAADGCMFTRRRSGALALTDPLVVGFVEQLVGFMPYAKAGLSSQIACKKRQT
jgi:hypothetical protein